MYKIEYQQDNGLVTSITDATETPVTLQSEGVAYYNGEIPEDREGFTKELYWGVDPDVNVNTKARMVNSETLYAVYTSIDGWLELATMDYVSGVENRVSSVDSKTVQLEQETNLIRGDVQEIDAKIATKANQSDLVQLEQKSIQKNGSLFNISITSGAISNRFIANVTAGVNYKFKIKNGNGRLHCELNIGASHLFANKWIEANSDFEYNFICNTSGELRLYVYRSSESTVINEAYLVSDSCIMDMDAKIDNTNIGLNDVCNMFNLIDFNIDGYINTFGLINKPSAGEVSKATDFVKVETGDIITVSGCWLSTGGYKFAAYDADKNILKDYSILGNASYNSFIVTISSDSVKYIRASYYRTDGASVSINRARGSYDKEIKRLDAQANKFSEGLSLCSGVSGATIENIVIKNLFEPEKVELGKGVYPSGAIVSLADSAIFTLDVNKDIGKYLTLSGLPIGINVSRYYVFKDATGNIVGKGDWHQGKPLITVEIPDNAATLTFSVYQSQTIHPEYPLLQIEYGSEATKYIDRKEISDSLLIEKNGAVIKIADEKKDLSILIFGDSITETNLNYVYDDTLYYTKSFDLNRVSNWPIHLIKIMESKYTINMRNYAKSGARFRNAQTSDKRHFLGFQIDQSFADLTAPEAGYYYNQTFNPDIIIVSIGTNDGDITTNYDTAMSKSVFSGSNIDLDATLANLSVKSSESEAMRHSFIRLRRQFPNAVMLYVTPIQRASMESPISLLDTATKMANRYNFIIVDCNSQAGIVRDFQKVGESIGDLVDGLHPNLVGQQKIAKCIYSVMRNLL